MKNPLAAVVAAPITLEQCFEQIDHDRDTQQLKADVSAILHQLQQASDDDIAHQLAQVGLADHITPDQLRAIMRRRARRLGLINDDARLQAYRDYLARAYQYVDFVGIAQQARFVSLALDNVFVPLSAAPEETPQNRYLEERDRLGDLEDASTVTDRERIEDVLNRLEGDRLLGRPARDPPTVVTDILRRHAHVVFLGGPGSGKTTLLRWLARTCARGAEALRDSLGCDEDLLPLLLPLADYGRALEDDRTLTLAAHLRRCLEHLREHEGAGFGDLILERLDAGGCLVLLDGLDQIPDPGLRLHTTRGVFQLMAIYPKSRYVVTSRVYGYYRYALSGGVPHYVLQGFTDDEMKQFAHHWWLAYERVRHPDAPDLAAAEQQAEDLIGAIFEAGHPQLVDFARNPLLLTILALIKQQQVVLPERRVQLYHIALNTLMESWVRARAFACRLQGVELDLNQSLRVWQRVAFWMHDKEPTGTVHRAELMEELQTALVEELALTPRESEQTAESYLQAAVERTGLLQARGEDLFGFLHQTFQEYLTARHIARPPHTAFDRIASHLHDPRWREVMLLTAGYLGTVLDQPEDAGQFVDRIRTAGTRYEDILHRDLLLAVSCLADRIPVDPKCERDAVGALADALSGSLGDRAAEVLTSALTRVQTDRPASELLAKLTTLLSHTDSRIRAAAVITLGKCESPDVRNEVRGALDDSDPNVAGRAAVVLLKHGCTSGQLLKAVMRALACDAPGLKQEVSYALRAFGIEEQAARYLFTRLCDQNPLARAVAAHALTTLGRYDEQVVRLLLAQLRDDESHIRRRAVGALGNLAATDGRVFDALLERLSDDNRYVRGRLAEVISDLGMKSPSVVPALLSKLEHGSTRIRLAAWWALTALGQKNTAVARELIPLLAHQQADVRAIAARTLAWMGIDQDGVIGVLVTQLGDDFGYARWNAAEALGRLRADDMSAIAALMQCLGDGHPDVRWTAAEALAAIGQDHPQVVAVLTARLNDDRTYVRRRAVEALGRLSTNDDAVLTAIARSLTDEEASVRRCVSRALRRYVPLPNSALATLRSFLSHSDPDVRYHAATVLVADEAARL